MRTVSHQVLIGVFVGAVLTIGAGPIGGAGHDSLSLNGVAPFGRGGAAYLAATFTHCRNAVLNVALDAYGELAAGLKQI